MALPIVYREIIDYLYFMNLRDLQYIIAVANFGHFGRAAQACHISQPTLSGQILKLEDELGVRIFERVGKSVCTTAAGEEILVHARRAVAASEDLLRCARASRDPMAGALRLGVIPTLGPYLMPFVLPRARRQLPATPLMLVEDFTDRLIEPVLSGKLDAAIIASDPEKPVLTSELLFEEPFFLIVPRDHALAERESVAAGEIDPQSLLLLADGHCLRDQAIELCRQAQPDDSLADMRATSLPTLLHMAAAGYGITLMPALALLDKHSLPHSLIAKPLTGPHTARSVRLVSRSSNPRRKAIDALAKLIKTSLPPEIPQLSA
ncbi:LysR substrate-binding domain-containing protein [Beijerinckia indica]|uniref:Transcriptional regulator, LysR family n=1 Tax=Beijerinckia indica subsp. indica (strain ATCC 9039 / DSM 1715 / NCIMB 8712) TaxID=395963 RepID=B2IHZ5_BEII9|nr:LysR substrate-binding domain-containing protein [Beijerinckia indica]ACB96041.1 transcriptional regulator, LysR family [Beijerinckia indica subsp. indica ATCC 9039]